ncbi:MAG: PASTA domain-containing protein [Actinomycetes bacterium]
MPAASVSNAAAPIAEPLTAAAPPAPPVANVGSTVPASWPARHKGLTIAAAIAGAVIVIAAIASAAGGSSKSNATPAAASAPAAVSQPTAPAKAAAIAPKPKAKATKPAAAPKAASGSSTTTSSPSWTMPNLVGKDLQTAQDTIQSITRDGIWFTHSHDVSGDDRMQILDRDWQVCNQNVPSGAKIRSGSNIDFGVVKFGETCP